MGDGVVRKGKMADERWWSMSRPLQNLQRLAIEAIISRFDKRHLAQSEESPISYRGPNADSCIAKAI